MSADPIAIAPDEPAARLGTPFWAAWFAGMIAISVGFCGAIYAFSAYDSPGGPIVGGLIVLAFTAVLAGVANLPHLVRRKRGIDGRMRAPYRRYMRRFMPAMFGYVILLMLAVSYAKAAAPTGVVAWAIAIAPALPLLLAIRAIFLLPREEDDEYQRERIYHAYAWATGATLAICTVWGFLDMFVVVPHAEMWLAFPIWSLCMGLARCLPLNLARGGGAK